MAKNTKIKATLKDASNAKHVWEENPGFKVGDIGLNDFRTMYDAAQGLDQDCAKRDVELTGL